MSYNDIGDNELIYLIRNQNNQAKECLIERYKKRIYGMINDCCSSITTFNVNYDDYYQDCFIVFLKCLESYDEDYNFYSYLKQAIEKCIRRKINKEKVMLKYVSIEDDLSDNHPCLVDKVSDSAIIYNENELHDYIDESFEDIDKLIIDYKIKGYSYLEISKFLGIRAKNLYKRVDKIKEKLRLRI